MRKLFVVGLMVLGAGPALAGEGYNVLESKCYVIGANGAGKDVTLVESAAGEFTADLGSGVVATLKAHDSGYNHIYHLLSVRQGTLEVTNQETTQIVRTPGVEAGKRFIRVSGKIEGRYFHCDATVEQL